MTENQQLWQEELAAQDRDRYMCALLEPEEKRTDVLALLAWNMELARVAEQAREPMVGLIRQAWWRDVLEEIQVGKPSRPHAVVQAMAGVMGKSHLPLEVFSEIVHARGADLEPAPFTTLQDMEDYCAQTSGNVQQLWAMVVHQNVAEAKNTGTAWGVIGTLRATHHLAHQNKLRLPTQMLADAGVKQDDVLRGQPSAGLSAVTKQIVQRAEALLAGSTKTPLSILTWDYAARIRKAGYHPFDPRIENGRAMRALKLFFA